MSDALSELKNAIIGAVDQGFRAGIAERGFTVAAPQLIGTPSHNTPAQFDTFATGYSGGLTVMPFMLDYSALDGGDVLMT